jgi:hypothetical protein
MKTALDNGYFAAGPDHDRDAAIETIRQLLQKTEELATDADFTEVAFFIGVALASLRQESRTSVDLEAIVGPTTRVM